MPSHPQLPRTDENGGMSLDEFNKGLRHLLRTPPPPPQREAPSKKKKRLDADESK